MTEKNKNGVKFDKKAECIVFSVFAFLLAVVSLCHEPWFDEAQAWQIARCATLKEILFEIPHYEGHPALWHLMLSIPAKLGVPYEFGLGIMSYIAILISGYLLIFRSPFPILIRCLLPFHYFIFYQNGVVSRPYGLMTLVFFLIAVEFRNRNRHPLRFAMLLAVLCMLSAYGIVLSGGIALAWLLEILREHEWSFVQLKFWKDIRIYSLMALLVLAVLLILQIMPYPNTYAHVTNRYGLNWDKICYSLFFMFLDGSLFAEVPGLDAIFSYCLSLLAGLLIVAVLLLFSTKRNRNYFLFPYLFFAFFTAVIYFSSHHLGIHVAFLVSWLWIAWEDEERGRTLCQIGRALSTKFHLTEKDGALVRKFLGFVLLLPVIVPVIWCLVASYRDIVGNYFFSRNTAMFFKEHGLQNATFVAEWGEVIDKDWTEEEYFEKINANGLYVGSTPVAYLPYFDHNFCLNLNCGRDDKAYSIHCMATAEESRRIFEKLRELGPPDGMIGLIDLSEIYGDEVKNSDYVPVYRITPHFVSIWKIFSTNGDSFKSRYVYVREDLLEKYGLEKLNEWENR